MSDLIIEAISGPPLEANSYFVGDREAGEALLIDAPVQIVGRIQQLLTQTGTTLRMVVCTHGHFDHVLGVAEVAQAFQSPVACHPDDAEMLQHPSYGPFSFPYPLVPVTPARLLNDGDAVTVGSHTFTVIHAPGHTLGGICLYAEADGVLFTGDILFRGSYGRIDLPGGSPEAMARSLQRLAALPSETRVYPGHGPATTIGRESWLREIAEMDL